MTFTPNDIEAIAAVLGTPETPDDHTWFWNLKDEKSGRVMAFTLTLVEEGDMVCGVVSAQTHQGYVELHDVSGHLCIEPDEVMFVAKTGDRFASLVIGNSCTCSQFANIPSSLISKDLMDLDPTYLMAAMQLSLAEGTLISD